MDPRDLAWSNGVSFSVGTLHANAALGTNWGVPSGPLVVIALDPQVDVRPANLHDDEDAYDIGLAERHRRRTLMARLSGEFTVLHDRLLRELAR